MNLETGFLLGVLGGLFAELLGWFEVRKLSPGRRPEFLKSKFYWILTAAMILAGGALVDVYLASDISFKPIIAVNIGASAPLIIGKLVAQAPTVEPGTVN